MRKETVSHDRGMLVNRGRSGLLFLLGIVITMLGSAFAFLLVRGHRLAAAYDAWAPTPALILASWIETLPQPSPDPPRYRFRVNYRYEVEGQERIAARVTDLDGSTRQRAKVRRLKERFPVGEELDCYVNPADPGEAILLRPTKAAGYTLWFPGLFVVGGAGMCVVALRRAQR